MDPCKALREWRGKRSLNEAGKLIGIDPSYVSCLEHGKVASPTVTVAAKIEAATGIPVKAWDANAVPAAEAAVDPVAESA